MVHVGPFLCTIEPGCGREWNPVRTGFFDARGLNYTQSWKRSCSHFAFLLGQSGGRFGEKRRKPSWVILSLGFGGLLICIVAAAVGTLVALQRVRNTEAHSRKAFLERLSALDQIRAQIYLSGTYVRDFLLSPDPDTAKAQAAHLATLRARDPQRSGCLRPRTGARGTGAVSCAAQRD